MSYIRTTDLRGGGYTTVALLFLLGSLFVPEATAQDSLERYDYRQTHMGMAVRVVLYAPTDTTARRAGSAAFQHIAALESNLSSYRSSSELNRLSEHAGKGPVRVSDGLFEVLQRSQRLSRQSNGAFDVTVGPYVDLWERARRTGRLPDSTTLNRAANRVGWEKVRLNAEHQTVQLRADSMQLTLGGIAKGYILDRALQRLSAHGISRAMIEAGGDLVASGPPPDQNGWRIQLPAANADGSPRTVAIHHSAVSTSGDIHQFVEIDGTRYSHVVDPRTGLGLTHRLLVTIVADDGATADALATTVGILGADRGRTFLDTHYPNARAYIRSAGTLGLAK